VWARKVRGNWRVVAGHVGPSGDTQR
jgi:hypothetical protein